MPERHYTNARLLVENPFVEHDNSSNTTAGGIRLLADARLLVENPFVEHDNSSNTTAGRKKRPSPTLGRFYFYLKYDT